MVKHRQLARQVGAFDKFFLESSADLDLKMTYLAGTTFIFGSWICKAGGDSKLRTRLREEKEFDDKNNPVEQELAEKNDETFDFKSNPERRRKRIRN